ADRNRSHWSTSKTPSYTKSVSWQHHPNAVLKYIKRFLLVGKIEFWIGQIKHRTQNEINNK
ncbi:hypothetical protein L2099_17510, partial [Citrobacter portucalensis]|nr:hypothetical protein [Citrobacter portucalensis]